MTLLFFRESEIKDIHSPALGATETCVVELAKALSKYHQVFVIAPCIPDIYDNVQYINHKNYIESVEFMKQLHPDVVIVVGNPKILFYDIKFHCKVIFWQHNHPDEMSWPIKDLNCQIVFPSPESAEYAKKHYKNVTGIYNGVRNVFKPCQQKEKNTICYVGSLVRTKGVLEVLKSAVQLKEYIFYIAGSFEMYGYRDPEYEGACLSVRSENIFYTGALQPELLSKLISRCELCVVNPIIDNKETCCVSALESMACGTPVIAGKSLIEPIISHGGISTTNLIQSIQELMQDSGKRQQLAENGKKWVSELTWNKIALQWQQIF